MWNKNKSTIFYFFSLEHFIGLILFESSCCVSDKQLTIGTIFSFFIDLILKVTRVKTILNLLIYWFDLRGATSKKMKFVLY